MVAWSIATLARAATCRWQWIGFSLLTFATGFFTLKMPSIDALLSVSEIFAFSCVLLFGPELGALTVAVDALLLSLSRAALGGADDLQLSATSRSRCGCRATLFFAAAGVAAAVHRSAPPRVG